MRNRKSSIFVFVLAAAALYGPAARADPPGPVVETREGPVRGLRAGGIDKFLGIPYAAAPAGDLRWQPPRAHPRWKGVRDATQFEWVLGDIAFRKRVEVWTGRRADRLPMGRPRTDGGQKSRL